MIFTRGLCPGSVLIFLVLEVLTFVEARDFEYQSGSRTKVQLEGLVPSFRRRLVLALVFEFNHTDEGLP